MPNWCQQYGEVRGDNAELKRFVDAIRVEQTAEWLALKEFQRPYWDMNQLFPIPKELSDTISGGYGVDEDGNKKPEQIALEKQEESNIAKYGFKNWYDWAYANWDTKWGACDIIFGDEGFDEKSSKITLDWQSAWSPCVGLIKNISQQFPALLFGFHMTEEANFFAGFMVIKNGTVLDEYEYDMSTMPTYPDSPTPEQEEQWETAHSDWSNTMLYEIAEGMDTAMTTAMISQSSWM